MKKEIGDLTLNEIINICSSMSYCKCIKDKNKDCPLFKSNLDCSLITEINKDVLKEEIEVEDE